MFSKVVLLAACLGAASALNAKDYCAGSCFQQFPHSATNKALLPQYQQCVASCFKIDPNTQPDTYKIDVLKFEACRLDGPRCGLTPSSMTSPGTWAPCLWQNCMDRVLAPGTPYPDDVCFSVCNRIGKLSCIKQCRSVTAATAGASMNKHYLAFTAVRPYTSNCGLNPNTLTRPGLWEACVEKQLFSKLPVRVALTAAEFEV